MVLGNLFDSENTQWLSAFSGSNPDPCMLFLFFSSKHVFLYNLVACLVMVFSRGQGSLEYLLIIGVALIVVSVAIVGITGVVDSGSGQSIDSNNTLNPLKHMAGGSITILDIVDSFADSAGDLLIRLTNQGSESINVSEIKITSSGGASSTSSYSSNASVPTNQVSVIFIDSSACVCPVEEEAVTCNIKIFFSNNTTLEKQQLINCTSDVTPGEGNITPIDSTPPVVALLSPGDNNIQTSKTISFEFSATDNKQISSCVLSAGSESIVLSNLVNGINTAVVTLANDFSGNWSVSCTDGNNTTVSSARTILVDSTSPIISLLSPSTGASVDNFDFVFSADDLSTINECSFFIDGVLRRVISLPQKQIEHKITFWNNDASASHTWGVSCTDSLGHVASPLAQSFTNPFTSFANLSACPATLSVANSYNTLTQNISYAGNCINVGANGVAIDGNGKTITGNISGSVTVKGASAYNFILNNLTLSGDVVSNGMGGLSGGYGVDGQNGGNGGSVKIINSTVFSLTSIGGSGGIAGQVASGGIGGNTGSVLILNSNVNSILLYGGGGGRAFYAGSGGSTGTITIVNSTASSVSAFGGPGGYGIDSGFDGYGGNIGLISVTDSTISTIDSSGGDVWGAYAMYRRSGGSAGNIELNNVSNLSSINAKGGDYTGDAIGAGGNGGSVIFNSCPEVMPSIDVSGGIGSPAGNNGTITPEC